MKRRTLPRLFVLLLLLTASAGSGMPHPAVIGALDLSYWEVDRRVS